MAEADDAPVVALDVSQASRELVDLSAEAIGSLGAHMAQLGVLLKKGALPPPKGDKSTAVKIRDKLNVYNVYTSEVDKRRKDLEDKMKTDFERLAAWRKQSGTEGASLIEELESLYHKIRAQAKEIETEKEKVALEQEKVRLLILEGELKDRKWASLSKAFCEVHDDRRKEISRRAIVCSWIQCSYDEIRFRWKAAAEKEKLKIEHLRRMRKARAQSRLDVINKERLKRVAQACFIALQEEAVEGRTAKHLFELRRKQSDEMCVMNAQLAQALGDEEKAKALVAEQVRRLEEARKAQAEAERQAKIAQREAREARGDAEAARRERDKALQQKKEAEELAQKCLDEKLEAEKARDEALEIAEFAEQARLRAQAEQREAEEQVRKKQKKILSLQRMLAELGAESDSDAPPDERAPAFFVNEDGTKVPRPRTRKERMGMAYREAETARCELRIGMAAMIDKDQSNQASLDQLRVELGNSMREVREVRWANKVLAEDNEEVAQRCQRAEALAQQAAARARWAEEEASAVKLLDTSPSRPSTGPPPGSTTHLSTQESFARTAGANLFHADPLGPPNAPLAPSTAGLGSHSPTMPSFFPAPGQGGSPRLLLKTKSQPIIMPPLHGPDGRPPPGGQSPQANLAPLRKTRKPPPDWRLGWH
eukprot:TRINITY_DN31736_c0_g1_i1.p1 TRINITY_DN31736_c0_g1~~TRINITY_DN31736_c0_g1_i1.p1  ORF type:complete len:653 (-),score=180.38 TRINITY_DN31736_c0_g1_i1:126-2084(-)